MRNIVSPLDGFASPFGRADTGLRFLFANGEAGAWYDPSDLSTLFQDSAGTTPVTASGDPVGLMLDKSGNGINASQAVSASRPTYGIVPATGRRNLFTYTEAFDHADWTKGNATVSPHPSETISDQWSYWEGPEQPPIRTDEPGTLFLNVFSVTVADVMAKWEAIRSANSGYVSRSVLGQSGNGADIYEYIFEPASYSRTILLSAGIHGSERSAVFALVRLMHHIANDYSGDDALTYLRNNVRIVCIPIANPDGFDANTRQNANGVDLNRNFDYEWSSYPSGDPFDHDYKGTAAFSEAESQVMRDWLASYHDAFAFLDFHNFGGARTESYPIYIGSDDLREEEIVGAVQDELVSQVSGATSTPISSTSNPSGFTYAADRHAMLTANPEWGDGGWGSPSYGIASFTRQVEFYGNLVYAFASLDVGAWKLTETASTGTHYLAQAPGFDVSDFTKVVELRAAERGFALIAMRNTAYYIGVNLDTGQVTDQSGGVLVAETEALDNGWWRVRVSISNSSEVLGALSLVYSSKNGLFSGRSYAGDAGSGIVMRRPQIERSDAPSAYQRVGSQFDVTEEGVKSLGYLFFDGVDDFMTLSSSLNLNSGHVFFGLNEPDSGLSSRSGLLSSGSSGYISINNSDPRSLSKNNSASNESIDTPSYFLMTEQSAVSCRIDGGTIYARRSTADVESYNSILADHDGLFSTNTLMAFGAAGQLPARVDMYGLVLLVASPSVTGQARTLAYLNRRMGA